MASEANSAWQRLVETMARLRGEGGCPWDREQTHESLTPYLLEETYEVLEALEARDPSRLQEELGDLLLQIAFHARLAEEAGQFDLEAVAAGICDKLVQRHPHVFGEGHLTSSREVLKQWESIKLAEKADTRKSLLDGIPVTLPALLRALRLQNRAAEVGFDWDNVAGTMQKVEEELGELCAAMEKGPADEAGTRDRIKEEVGDLLFAVVNLARWLSIDPEQALQRTNRKFRERFGLMEEASRRSGIPLDSLDLEQLDALWNQAKAALAVSPPEPEGSEHACWKEGATPPEETTPGQDSDE